VRGNVSIGVCVGCGGVRAPWHPLFGYAVGYGTFGICILYWNKIVSYQRNERQFNFWSLRYFCLTNFNYSTTTILHAPYHIFEVKNVRTANQYLVNCQPWNTKYSKM